MLQPVIIAIVFLLGLGVGSFINVITIRFQPDKNIPFIKLVSGRSRCNFCKHQLKWYDLIPIFSFIFLKGKCRYCGKKISSQYPIVEILTGVIFAGVTYRILRLDVIRLLLASGTIPFWIWFVLLLFLFYSAVLITLSIIDIKHYLLPDRLIYSAIGVSVVADLFFYGLSKSSKFNFPSCGLNFLSGYMDYFNCQFNVLTSYLLGALVVGGFLFLIYLFTRGKGMGLGDVKLGILIGLMLGLTNGILALVMAFIIGSIVGIILLASKKKSLKDWVPFGPFLALGVLIIIFWGSFFVESYFSIFNYLI